MRYTNIINKIKGNKRILYLSFCIVLILFSLVLNITFSKYTSNLNKSNANIVIGDLKYNMQVNNGELEDRILRITKSSTLTYDIGLSSLNNIDTKYELIYDVCSDKDCTNTIDMPSDLDVKVSSDSSNAVVGSINKNNYLSLTIVGINDSATSDYYIKLGLNAGYSHNELALVNQINETYYVDDVTIIAFVDGKELGEFPSERNYFVTYECKVGNTVVDDVVVNSVYLSDHWKLTVDNVTKSRTACNVYFEAYEGTLLDEAIRKNYPTISKPVTTPGSRISNSTEKVLAETADDYGTSYYFRGAINNNYVEFAGKCWRIVRITGNGAIKLVLHNDNVDKVENPCDSSYNSNTAAFARYDGTTYTSEINSFGDVNASVGYMYGDPWAYSYDYEHANVNDSVILTNLKTWYDLSFNSKQKNKLADVIWCNDKSTVDGDGSNTNDTTYGAWGRESLSLICPNDNSGGKLSKFTGSETTYGNGALKGYKIGLLTQDEITFAGAINNKNNTTYYLYENAKEAWWSMSPATFSSSAGVSLVVNVTPYSTSGVMPGIDYSYATSALAVRPSIALIPTITISAGTGTSSDPFLVI